MEFTVNEEFALKITEYIKNNTVILDGGMGTLLQASGLKAGELPEEWNITHPEVVRGIHRGYLDAGSNVISTNTFGANSLKFSADQIDLIISAAVENARRAINESKGDQPKWVALDIGPTGRMLKPIGDLDFDDAVEIFAETVRLGVKHGVNLIFIETMADSYETKAALLAAKENSDLPVFVSNAYGEDGKLMTGADPRAMIALLEGMGADAIGVNCSLGPRALYPIVEEYLKYSSLPVILKPNAGLPRSEKGKTVYDLSPSDFASQVARLVNRGVRAVGGCCGTTPEYICALCDLVKDTTPLPLEKKNITLVSSYTHAHEIGECPTLIGERINPTGKPKFREAVKSGNIDYILREAIGQQDRGAHILDVNLGIPGIDETTVLTDALCRVQEICDLPLQIDTADPVAMERALRRYNGKAMINSVNGKEQSMKDIFPLAKKYGGAVVCLTLDENGIPDTAEGRFNVAKKIYDEALRHGIEPKDLIFDPLAMAVSADKNAARETLLAVKYIRERLGCHTLLGISNVSFGLPSREIINANFFTLALSVGLSAAIINPYSDEIMMAYQSYLALSGEGGGILSYISSVTESADKDQSVGVDSLKDSIVKGLRDRTAQLIKEELAHRAPVDILNEDIIPALDMVGKGYEEKKIYLPGLLMSAEAAGVAFEAIKEVMPKGDGVTKRRIVLATVKGDIHDIGKNIVKMLLENYGFDVTDLGKDVSPEKIADAVVSLDAELLGLSALMTTTLPAMEETVRLVRKIAPKCKIMVGGAVLNEVYAKEIGADFYGKDAMEAVRFANTV